MINIFLPFLWHGLLSPLFKYVIICNLTIKQNEGTREMVQKVKQGWEKNKIWPERPKVDAPK